MRRVDQCNTHELFCQNQIISEQSNMYVYSIYTKQETEQTNTIYHFGNTLVACYIASAAHSRKKGNSILQVHNRNNTRLDYLCYMYFHGSVEPFQCIAMHEQLYTILCALCLDLGVYMQYHTKRRESMQVMFFNYHVVLKLDQLHSISCTLLDYLVMLSLRRMTAGTLTHKLLIF